MLIKSHTEIVIIIQHCTQLNQLSCIECCSLYLSTCHNYGVGLISLCYATGLLDMASFYQGDSLSKVKIADIPASSIWKGEKSIVQGWVTQIYASRHGGNKIGKFIVCVLPYEIMK